MMKIKGFTLVEVLLVIVVLAILVVMFFQVVYNTYVRYNASAKLKKFDSLIKQIQLKAKFNDSNWEDYYNDPDSIESAGDFVNKYILPYVTYRKKDRDEDGNVRIYVSEFAFSVKKDECMTFILDTNSDNPPHVDGQDLFYFLYCPKNSTSFVKQGELIPYMTTQITSRESAREACKNNPITCSGFAAFDEYELDSDYPHILRS